MALRHPPARPAWQAERRLVADLKKGRPEARAAFARDLGPALHRLARTLAADEETTRELFVEGLGQALERSAFRQEDQELCGWLAGQILVSHCREDAAAAAGQSETDNEPAGEPGRARGGRRGGRGRRRHGQRRQEAAAPAADTPQPPPAGAARDWSPGLADPATREALTAALRRAGAGLPADLRHAWLLADAAGLGSERAATALELTQGVLRGRLHRARLWLRAALETAAPLPAAAGAETPAAGEDCLECRLLLRGWADGDLEDQATAGVEAHLAACAGCAGLARSYRGVIELARELTPPAPPTPDLEALAEAAVARARGLPPPDSGGPAGEEEASGGPGSRASGEPRGEGL